MNKNSTHLVGLGGCGCKLIDTFLSIDAAYDRTYINSNINEMSNLKFFNSEINALMIAGQGTGRDRNKSKEHLKGSKSKFFTFFENKINLYNSYVLFSSLDGGFGSGSVELVSTSIRSLEPDAKIIFVGACPKSTSRKVALENALDCYSDLLKLKKSGIINSIILIDNDKMEEEESFNRLCMNQLVKAFSMNNVEIDENDCRRVNGTSGYNVILELDSDYEDMAEAINEARQDSPFIIPTGLKCTSMLATFVKEDYNKDQALDMFTVRDFDKTDYNDENNMILLGGCKMPTAHMGKLKDKVAELEALHEEDDDDEEELFIANRNKKNGAVKQEVKKENTTSSKQRLRAMLDDDIWN